LQGQLASHLGGNAPESVPDSLVGFLGFGSLGAIPWSVLFAIVVAFIVGLTLRSTRLGAHIYAVGGKGHSCGVYSHDDDHIDALARLAPVSRMMVRQPQSKANAGAWTNGMPMTSSLGCGIWGGNITNENVTMKHMMNYTWVSRPIPEDRPSEQELFGEFYGREVA